MTSHVPPVVRRWGMVLCGLGGLGLVLALVFSVEGLAEFPESGVLRLQVFLSPAGTLMVAIYGFWVYSGHRFGRNFLLAIIGPLLIGVTTPMGFVLMVLSLWAARVVNRSAVQPSSPGAARDEAEDGGGQMKQKAVALEWLLLVGLSVVGFVILPIAFIMMSGDPGFYSQAFLWEIWIIGVTPYLLVQFIRSIIWAVRIVRK